MYKIKDKQDRSILSEGRNYGLGYAFLQRTDNTYETVQPISPCKDYLNDVVFSEQTGKPCSAYGLDTEQGNIFENPYSFMAIKICKKFIDLDYKTYNQDKNNLNQNYKNIQKLVNYYEKLLNINYNNSTKTKIFKTTKKDIFIVKINNFWTDYTYTISLLSFILRLGLPYDGILKPEEFIKTFKHHQNDEYQLNDIKVVLKEIITFGKFPKQDFDKLCNEDTGDTNVHNYGIITLKNDIIKNKIILKDE